jgi:hypothetical protein
MQCPVDLLRTQDMWRCWIFLLQFPAVSYTIQNTGVWRGTFRRVIIPNLRASFLWNKKKIKKRQLFCCLWNKAPTTG